MNELNKILDLSCEKCQIIHATLLPEGSRWPYFIHNKLNRTKRTSQTFTLSLHISQTSITVMCSLILDHLNILHLIANSCAALWLNFHRGIKELLSSLEFKAEADLTFCLYLNPPRTFLFT